MTHKENCNLTGNQQFSLYCYTDVNYSFLLLFFLYSSEFRFDSVDIACVNNQVCESTGKILIVILGTLKSTFYPVSEYGNIRLSLGECPTILLFGFHTLSPKFVELQITFLKTQRLQTSILMLLDKKTQNIEKDEDGHGMYTLFLHT